MTSNSNDNGNFADRESESSFRDPGTDDTVETTDAPTPSGTATPEYECPKEGCGRTFSGESAQQRMASHVRHEHPSVEEPSSSDSPTGSSKDGSSPVSRSLFERAAAIAGGFSGKETGTYRGWFSTRKEIAVFVVGMFGGVLLAHNAISLEILAGVGGAGSLIGADAAARKQNTELSSTIASDLGHYILGILLTWGMITLPHEILPEGWSVDTLWHSVFGDHAPAAHSHTIISDAVIALL